MALREADYASFEQRQAEAREQGRYIGFGMVAFAETAVPSYFGMIGAFGGEDSCTIRIEPDRSVTALVGTAPQGQGHETSFAQVVADALDVHPDMVTIRHSDTAAAPYGLGAWGSRSSVVAGGAAILACEKVKAKLCAIAAHIVEGEVADIRWISGGVEHVPTGKVVAYQDLVFAAYAGRSHLPMGWSRASRPTPSSSPLRSTGSLTSKGRRCATERWQLRPMPSRSRWTPTPVKSASSTT